MAINPYANCPCGSGKQFKWCCQPYYSYVEKALAQRESGQHAAAEQTMDQLVEKFSKVPQVLGYQAQVFFLNDKSEQAEAALEKAFNLDANFAYGYWLRGLMRLEEGEEEGALILFRKTAELLDPNARDVQAQVNTRIAELELHFNNPVAARAAMDRALHAVPQLQELQQARNSVFGPESRLPDSARRAYTFRPAPAAHSAAWGPILESAASGKLTDALKAFERLVEAPPTEPAAWFNLGLVRAWLGDNAPAIEALSRSMDVENDDVRAAETGALAEVLRCGRGMEGETDYVEHRAYLKIHDPDLVGNWLGDWGKSARLLPVSADREQGIFSALILEETPNLGVNVGTPVARLQSYMLLRGDLLRFWHSTRAMLDKTVGELRAKVGPAVSEPEYESGAAQFGDVVAEVMLFPTREDADPEQVEQKMRDQAKHFFEESWARRSLKSLAGASPLDAASHPTLKKRLPGVIRFMQECLVGVSPRAEGAAARPVYDFDRLRRKLGLSAAPAAEGTDIDFDSMSAAGLSGIKFDRLSDQQIGDAFRAALRLDAPDLAAGFARNAVARATISDRYPFFNHLIRTARDEGKTDEVLRLLSEAEAADEATNAGQRKDDYSLGRGQALARTGDADGAYTAFREAVSRSPNSLKLYAPAAEAMLGRKQGTKALEFAEAGLRQARSQNNRDAEQQFLELVAAAKKQI